MDLTLYNEYVFETKFVQTPMKMELVEDKPKPILDIKVPSDWRKISSLPHDHPAKLYVDSRQIPAKFHYKIYYVSDFVKSVNKLLPDKLSGPKEPRLIFPLLTADKKLYGFQGRSFSNIGLRYITIMLDDQPKIFGLDTVDFAEKYYVVEGPIDSLFLPNAIAMAGADLRTNVLPNPENAVYVFDVEPRNLEIINRMKNIISQKFNVAILPKLGSCKDINDLILAGYTQEKIIELIDTHTMRGLQAELRLSEWRKL
jgi:hypothetical protein